MNYRVLENKIIIYDITDFNVKQTLECGQIFRFEIENNVAKVFSLDNMAVLKSYSDRIEIETDNTAYFENFFDLKTDYKKIKSELKKDEFLVDAVDYGYGIRIIKNDFYEMIISFIISANNNISRIKKSIQVLCEKFGENKGGYFAFPTLNQLKTATILDFKNAGLGYRAEQLFETVQFLTLDMIDDVKNKSLNEQFNFLVSLKGVGEKVANCVLLFGLHRMEVFPVDTWINKVYNSLTKTETHDRKKITRELTERYGKLSGYAQQYFFYYFRDNKLS